MKSQFVFNKTWIVIAIFIIGNILLFNYMSRKLQTYVVNDVSTALTVDNI